MTWADKKFKEPFPITAEQREKRASLARLVDELHRLGDKTSFELASGEFNQRWQCDYKEVLEPLRAR
jgi:hypothetical protein